MLPFIMDPWLLSLIGFAIAASITPGPNNVMVTANAARFGLAATVPHMLGIAVGFALMIILVGLGVGEALTLAPWWVSAAMRWGALAWLLVMAWGIATAPPPGKLGEGRPFGFFAAMLFQWVNPKAWLLALSIATAWVRPEGSALSQLLVIGAVFVVVNAPCALPWALLGTGAARLFTSPAVLRRFNVAMAVLLVASMLPLVL
jgi:threonine/homoserine/homoserine lactone efflux protein